MPDSKITALTAITTVNPATFPLVIVDTSDTSMAITGTTKKVTTNQLLGSGGTATLASATITGDLTVKTNVLKVDTTNNRVGIGTATPATPLNIGTAVSRHFLANGQTTGSSYGEITTTGADVIYGAVDAAAGLFTNAIANASFFGSGNATSLQLVTNSTSRYEISSTGVATWSNVGGVAGTAMTLNSTGLGLGVSPSYKLDIFGTVRVGTANPIVRLETGTNTGFIDYNDTRLQLHAGPLPMYFVAGNTLKMTLDATGNLGVGNASPAQKVDVNGAVLATNVYLRSDDSDVSWGAGAGSRPIIRGNQTNNTIKFYTASTDRMTLDASGNVGIGVAPSAWATLRGLQNGRANLVGYASNSEGAWLTNNAFYDGSWKYQTSAQASHYQQLSGVHSWSIAGTGTAGTAITFTQAMTLDASGNLLVGITSGSYNRIKKDVTADAGNAIFELVGASNATSSIHYSVSSYNANAANAASKFGRDGVTLRSINAGGTVNASGADYAEYMTKASDFVLSKGGIAGIDANGKLTNVFADAVSFVVKSTDPSYVGNDKWGNDLEGDELEAARQLVDRIAFAGQVPVNVTGAKAGDYIVPVVDGTGIKGIAVSNPTFEQYQLAVGKVIAIDADGRARIIVKVA